jgi:hypothetical protein
MTRPLVLSCCVLALAASMVSRAASAQSADPSSPAPAADSSTSYPAQPEPPTSGSSSSPPPIAEPSSDDRKDSGSGLEWVWLNAEVGASYVNMESFNSNNLALEKTSSSGPSYGVAAGVRLLFLTLGAHVRDLSLSSIGDLWLLNLEAALHARVWRIDPYLGVRGGYNFVGSLSQSSLQVAMGSTPPDVSIHGFNIGPIAGLDVYLLSFLSIGADFDAQFLFLQRPVPPLPYGLTVQMLPPQDQTLYKESGSSVGFGFTAAAHVGLHY